MVEEHFAAMHTMAMEKFFIPVEICNQVANDQVKVHLLSFQDSWIDTWNCRSLSVEEAPPSHQSPRIVLRSWNCLKYTIMEIYDFFNEGQHRAWLQYCSVSLPAVHFDLSPLQWTVWCTVWCSGPHKTYIFCKDMILATCQCQHIFCCWVEPSWLLSISVGMWD